MPGPGSVAGRQPALPPAGGRPWSPAGRRLAQRWWPSRSRAAASRSGSASRSRSATADSARATARTGEPTAIAGGGGMEEQGRLVETGERLRIGDGGPKAKGALEVVGGVGLRSDLLRFEPGSHGGGEGVRLLVGCAPVVGEQRPSDVFGSARQFGLCGQCGCGRSRATAAARRGAARRTRLRAPARGGTGIRRARARGSDGRRPRAAPRRSHREAARPRPTAADRRRYRRPALPHAARACTDSGRRATRARIASRTESGSAPVPVRTASSSSA